MATTNYSWNLPTVGGSEDTWGTSLNANWTALDTLLGGVNATEFAILDGATVTTAELNILDGVTATTAELNILDGVTATAAEINLLDGATVALSDVTATAAEINVLDGISGIASQAEAEAGTATNKLMTPQRTSQAIAELALQIGDGQTFQVVTGSRSEGTTYTNSTGRPIYVSVKGSGPAGFGDVCYIRLLIDGKEWDRAQITDSTTSGDLAKDGTVTGIVPAGETYRADILTGGSISTWTELR